MSIWYPTAKEIYTKYPNSSDKTIKALLKTPTKESGSRSFYTIFISQSDISWHKNVLRKDLTPFFCSGRNTMSPANTLNYDIK